MKLMNIYLVVNLYQIVLSDKNVPWFTSTKYSIETIGQRNRNGLCDIFGHKNIKSLTINRSI